MFRHILFYMIISVKTTRGRIKLRGVYEFEAWKNMNKNFIKTLFFMYRRKSSRLFWRFSDFAVSMTPRGVLPTAKSRPYSKYSEIKGLDVLKFWKNRGQKSRDHVSLSRKSQIFKRFREKFLFTLLKIIVSGCKAKKQFSPKLRRKY